MKTAIVCTAFGTARAGSLGMFESICGKIGETFTVETVSFAFTSNFVRKSLADQGIHYESPVQAVARLLENHDQVIVQPFQIVAGGEYDKTVAEISALDGSGRCHFGQPLIRDQSDFPAIVKILLDRKTELFPETDSLVIAGHGNGDHHTDQLYIELDHYVQTINPHYAVATLETEPSLESIVERLKMQKNQSVAIIPLLFSAGKHVNQDIAGDHDHSWVRRFESVGITAKADLNGLGENETMVDIWIDRIATLF